jgi:hypothetical protein
VARKPTDKTDSNEEQGASQPFEPPSWRLQPPTIFS